MQKPDTLLPENIKKDVVIGGVTGTLEAGDTSETWVIKDNAPVDENSYELARTYISFASGGAKFVALEVFTDGVVILLRYYTTANHFIQVGGFEPGLGEDRFYWPNNAYKKLTFDTPPTGALLTWLQSNGVKQPDDTAVQDTKALTITSNGTVSVTPDAPYDALKKVDVTVNVASGGGGGAGFSVTFPATAAHWNYVSNGGIVQADGTVVDMYDYTNVSGKTFSNVVAIKCTGSNYHALQMVILSGKINAIVDNGVTVTSYLAVDGETTFTMMGIGDKIVWIPLADTVISSIEMYNTD